MVAYTLRDAQIGDVIITKASNTVSHCGIVVGNVKAKYPSRQVFHATGNGMVMSEVGTWSVKSDVYRPRELKDELRDALTPMADKLHDSGTNYGINRAIFSSWSGSSSFGSGARERLAKYRSRLTLDQAVVKNVYCSEAVVLVYQLACTSEEDRHFIKLDAKHTLPKTLRSYFDGNPTYWTKTGYEPG